MDIVVTHEHADLDALASLVGASRLYDGACGLRNAQVSELSRRYLALHKDSLPLRRPSEVDPAEVETAVVVDSRKRSRLGEFAEHLEAAARRVVYDHHPPSEDDLAADEVHVEPVGACATLLCEELERRELDLSEREATLMLLGIYADTGRLSFESTTPRDVEAAGYLLRRGARLPLVNRYLRDQFDLEERKLLAELLASGRDLELGAANVRIVTATVDGYIDGASAVVQHVMEMDAPEAMFAVLGFKGGHRVQVIARSRVAYIDVSEVVAEFGGGGHPAAAAAPCKGMSVEEVEGRLETILQEIEMDPTIVQDLMSSPVETIPRDLTLGECGERLAHWGISGAPVLRDGEIEGIVSRRDVERAAASDKLDLPVSSHMSHEPVTIGPEESLEDALERMTDRDIGRLPVVEEGRLVGIVTRTDVMERLYDRSEES